MAHELEDPPEHEQSERINPEAMKVKENTNDKNQHGQQDGRNAERVASAVHRMLVAGGILRDPLLVSAVTQHGYGDNIPGPIFLHFPYATADEGVRGSITALSPQY